MNVLTVEDDLDLAATIIDYMELESINCDHASNGVAGLNLLEQNHYDILVLDINLPKMDGLTLCETLRNKGMDIPVLMLTARDSLDDKLAGFESGADDYLVKPFALAELLVRIKALAGRRSGQIKRLQVHDLIFDIGQKSVTRNGQSVKLSPTGLKLLEALMRASPHPMSRSELIEQIWGEEKPDSNSLKVHVFRLRKAIDGGSTRCLIHTHPGIGFALYDPAAPLK